VGEKLLERLNMTIYDGTTLAPASLLNVTAGRFSGERGEIRPVVRQGIVVGAFRTGFEPVDRRLVYVHLETARELLRMQLDPDPATVLLVDGAADAALRGAAGEVGLRVSSASDFREEYLHAVLVPIRAFKDLVTVVLFAVAAGWVTHVVVDTILTDRRRLAVLRALGVPASLLVSPVAAALLAVASAGTLAGLALAWAVARALGTAGVRAPGFEHLDFVATLPPLAALGVALGALAVALVAAGGAALALRRIGVTEALRQS
jgi:ABC-type lipoprotein release transport system permease subunit